MPKTKGPRKPGSEGRFVTIEIPLELRPELIRIKKESDSRTFQWICRNIIIAKLQEKIKTRKNQKIKE